ncbi:MAG: hypothetical protein BWY09_00924 [Candidatus Hydrogenedentes bacterium ADurb.Bin179]|nr:MAG: hypothetical protein BWY09_00924 [Candidatus Hydrogenedentes bacterium ADurb.Bin179]
MIRQFQYPHGPRHIHLFTLQRNNFPGAAAGQQLQPYHGRHRFINTAKNGVYVLLWNGFYGVGFTCGTPAPLQRVKCGGFLVRCRRYHVQGGAILQHVDDKADTFVDGRPRQLVVYETFTDGPQMDRAELRRGQAAVQGKQVFEDILDPIQTGRTVLVVAFDVGEVGFHAFRYYCILLRNTGTAPA